MNVFKRGIKKKAAIKAEMKKAAVEAENLYEAIKAIENIDEAIKKENLEEIIQVATEWWTQAIKNPKFDNGDYSDKGTIAMMVATVANDNIVTPEVELVFKTELKKIIYSQLINPGYIVLSVDYWPNYYLAVAAQKAGLSAIGFPFKTEMHMDRKKVIVKDGYGADYQVIYDKNQKYTDEDEILEKENVK